MKYHYLISYQHKYGTGTAFITRGNKLNTAEKIVELAKELEKISDPQLERVGISNIIRLKNAVVKGKENQHDN